VSERQTMNISITAMTNFDLLGALLTIALTLVLIAGNNRSHSDPRVSSMTPVIAFLIGIVAGSIGLPALRKAHEPTRAKTPAQQRSTTSPTSPWEQPRPRRFRGVGVSSLHPFSLSLSSKKRDNRDGVHRIVRSARIRCAGLEAVWRRLTRAEHRARCLAWNMLMQTVYRCVATVLAVCRAAAAE
jgi:hypothetical protein